ncbi:uncharacterized protein LOC108913368 [Anoplophora glabripennis]|uniref:hydroxymethylbilane synthase n=1 Tax=Anoplophora glabripennis TaxID=217634 RepID=V5GX26_ANOGL|nr:uncharacterized protein LOC108913368 [Anoplophora glabripennis]
MSGDHKIRVGSRKSELALIQTKHVISLLKELNPEKEFEIVTMITLGDKVLDIPLPKIGEKSLFTKELELALVTGSVDFVVHSLKDLPTSLPEGMAIGAVLTREDPRDALVLQKDLSGYSLETLPSNSIIGTSSLRRTAQIAKKYPHLKVENIRGNLNTRLKKLDDLGKYQAIVLAAAGLKRIGWTTRISKILEPHELLYAVGQGALAVECRANDGEIINLLEPLYDMQTALRVTAERSFLKTLGGGCSAPVAISSKLRIEKSNQIKVTLNGAVWSLDGTEEIEGKEEDNIIVKNGLRCSTCPYNNNKYIEDIENLNECSQCPVSPTKEPSTKRQKLDDIPSDILASDPHEQCPIQIPIGADFMGKCPYLEGILVSDLNKCPVSGLISNYAKCPFLKESIASFQTDNAIDNLTTGDNLIATDNGNVKLFCGLVPHKDATTEGMESARKLGERLAQTLISKGALEVMSKAQSIIHGSITAGSN